MTMQERALQYLQKALNSPRASFHEQQWESIEHLLNNRKLLVVERTGWGKSMVYFLATRLMRDNGKGPTLLISPLLSLMRNQMDAAGRLHLCARSINSTNAPREFSDIERELRKIPLTFYLSHPNDWQTKISESAYFPSLPITSVFLSLTRLIAFPTGGMTFALTTVVLSEYCRCFLPIFPFLRQPQQLTTE